MYLEKLNLLAIKTCMTVKSTVLYWKALENYFLISVRVAFPAQVSRIRHLEGTGVQS